MSYRAFIALTGIEPATSSVLGKKNDCMLPQFEYSR